MQQLPTTIAMDVLIFTSACTAITWASINITIQFLTSTHAMAQPNCLLHNEGNGRFVEKTEAAGLNVDNDRYSFACAWGESASNGLPDLYVANDFGRNNLYRNNGDGTFTSVSGSAHVEDVGAGMSACWSDFNNDGNQDIYVANMWSAAGQRVSTQKRFQEKAPEEIRALYRRHARGNALYRNQGNGAFQNVSQQAGC